MTHAADPQVIAKLEDETGDRSVDIVRYDDETFGFVEYRRDPQGNHGWHPLPKSPDDRYPSEFAAYNAAIRSVPWLID